MFCLLVRPFPWDHELAFNNDKACSRQILKAPDGSQRLQTVLKGWQQLVSPGVSVAGRDLGRGCFSEVMLSNELRLTAEQQKKGH